MVLALIVTVCLFSEDATADEDIPKLQIIGVVEAQKIAEGKKITLRGIAYGPHPPEDYNYRWYLGTTLIGQTQDMTWNVKGRGVKSIKLVAEDDDGNEAELVVNVTIKPASPPPDTSLFGMICLSVAVTGIILVALAVVVVVSGAHAERSPRWGPGHR